MARRRPTSSAFVLASTAHLLTASCLLADIHYVWTNSPSPGAPFTNWVTAAHVIQESVDAAADGDTVLVTNGVYASGGRTDSAARSLLTNRLAVIKSLAVRSVNGPSVTTIMGRGPPGNTAVRCAYLAPGAVLAGFTLSSGATLTTGDVYADQSGAGVFAVGASVTDCRIIENTAQWDGGGAFYGTLQNTEIRGNSANNVGGGVYRGTLDHCEASSNTAPHGGGMYYGSATYCTIAGNTATHYGGGAVLAQLQSCVIRGNRSWCGGGTSYCELRYCTVAENVATSSGGGDLGSVIQNSVLHDNVAVYGGAAYFSALLNCRVSENAAMSGAGICGGTVQNCTVTGNSAAKAGGGCARASVTNSIVYFNRAPHDANYDQETALFYSCTIPSPAQTNAHNVTDDPLLASPVHISPRSPCIGRGHHASCRGSDIDGDAWQDPPSIGCDEYADVSVTGALKVAVHAEGDAVVWPQAMAFIANIDGAAYLNTWSFGDGTVASNAIYISHAWGSTGRYAVVLTAYNHTWPGGVSTTATVDVVEDAIYYVNCTNATPQWPYMSWATAAIAIQDAVDACAGPGSIILVTNGTYRTGGRTTPHYTLTNRLVVTQPIVIRSVNGPRATVIEGSAKGPVRCVYLANGAVLAGFTLTRGNTLPESSLTSSDYDINGGGAYAPTAVITNCIIIGNVASSAGGGTFGGVIDHCLVATNTADGGGGAYGGTLRDCTITGNLARFSGGGCMEARVERCAIAGNSTYGDNGGGVCGGTVQNSLILNNYADRSGGGTASSLVRNCVISGNHAGGVGGGSTDGVVESSTIVGNSASSGGGISGDNVLSCIVYFNIARYDSNHDGEAASMSYTCTSAPQGTNNISSEPRFVGIATGNFALSVNSPCIDSGLNAAWMTNALDAGGSPRIVNGRADMGAFEYHFDSAVKLLLQAPYDRRSHRMFQALSDRLPQTSPYSADQRVALIAPSNVTDWVLLQVRPDASHAPVFSKTLFLRPDGTLLDADGRTNVILEVSPLTTNYLMVAHRNHLAALTANPMVFTNQMVTYDFTTGPDKYLGGTNACVELAPGVWGLIAGDADGDGRITPTDRKIVEQQRGKTGYLSGDLNLDGKVDGND